MKDPYQVLGVPKNASDADIKSAFRQLGRQHHPDRNQDDPQAAQRFKEVNAAYQILSDPQKRRLYDMFGAAGLGAARAGGGGPVPGVPFDIGNINVDGMFADLLDALGIRFGDRGDIQLELTVSFEEAAFGCVKTVEYDRLQSCGDCGGSGAAKGSRLGQCTACNGRGRVRMQQGMLPITVERSCQRCHGRGQVVMDPCPRCRGVGMRTAAAKVDVEVPPGVETGSTKKMGRQGNVSRGSRTGDLEVVIRVRPHELFRRSGDNVVCTLPITFAQAVLGDEVDIPTLDGRGVLRVPPGTQPGTILRVRGKGIPRRMVGGRGDQLVDVQVEIPTDLSQRQKELVMQLAKELGESVQPQRRTFVDKLKSLFS